MLSRDEINEDGEGEGEKERERDGVVTSCPSGDEDWVDIQSNKKTTVALAGSSPPSLPPSSSTGTPSRVATGAGAGVVTVPKETSVPLEGDREAGGKAPGAKGAREEEEEDDEVIHITPQMKKTVGCVPRGAFCIVS
jgi:hypothetical protein